MRERYFSACALCFVQHLMPQRVLRFTLQGYDKAARTVRIETTANQDPLEATTGVLMRPMICISATLSQRSLSFPRRCLLMTLLSCSNRALPNSTRKQYTPTTLHTTFSSPLPPSPHMHTDSARQAWSLSLASTCGSMRTTLITRTSARPI